MYLQNILFTSFDLIADYTWILVWPGWHIYWLSIIINKKLEMMKKLLIVTVCLFAGVFLIFAVHHIVELTQAGLIDWKK